MFRYNARTINVRESAIIDPMTLYYVALLTACDALDGILMGTAGTTDSGTVGAWEMSQKSANVSTTPVTNNNPNINGNNGQANAAGRDN